MADSQERWGSGVVKWLTGFGTSLLGDQIYFLALAWAAVEVAEPATVGVILAAGSIPRLLILLVGGALADRMSPKRLIIFSDAGRTVTLVVVAAALTVGELGPVPLAVIALIFGILDGLFLPAVGALPPRLAPAHQMARVQAGKTVIQRGTLLLGAPLAGWIVAQSGLHSAFWLAAILFAASVIALSLITLRPLDADGVAPAEGSKPAAGESADDQTLEDVAPAKKTSVMADIGAGFRAVARHPVLPMMLVLVAVTDIGFSGPTSAGLPILAKENGWGATGVGYVLGGVGLGAAATGITLAIVRRIPRAGLIAYISLAWMGINVVLIGLATTPIVAVIAGVLLGLGMGVYGTLMNALLITTTPPSELGRMMSLLSLASYGAVPLSYAATGVLAGAMGAKVPFYVGGVIVIVAGLVGLMLPRLRVLELATPAPKDDDDGSSGDESVLGESGHGESGHEESGAQDAEHPEAEVRGARALPASESAKEPAGYKPRRKRD